MSRFINPIPQFMLSNGDVASSGTLTFYEYNTDVLLTIYGDENLTTTITNPVTLGDRGEVPNIFFSETARVVFRDSEGNQIFDVQPLATGGDGSGGISGWDANTTYSQFEIVYASDGEYYVSNVNDNTTNDPTDTTDDSGFWTRLEFIRHWNAQESYQVNDVVFRSGKLYVGQSSDNLNNIPTTDLGTNWRDITDALLSPYDNTASGLASTNVKQALDELVVDLGGINSATTYRGQLDVSAGDSALPLSPSNGDLYIISTGGTITVSSNGGSPTPTPVTTGQAIVYNSTAAQWDLLTGTDDAVNINYSNVTSGLPATNVQVAIDELDALVDTNTSGVTALNNTLLGLGAGATYRGQFVNTCC